MKIIIKMAYPIFLISTTLYLHFVVDNLLEHLNPRSFHTQHPTTNK